MSEAVRCCLMCLLSFLLYLYFLVTGLYPSRISFSRKRQKCVFHFCICICICICWRRVSALPRSASPARGKKAQKSFEQIHSLEKTSMTGSIHSPDLYYSEESYPISLSWKQISFDLQTKGTPHRRKTVFFRALPKLPLPTRAGCRWRRQLDVQISLQHSTLSGGGQGSLSTSFPHPTEGVEDAEELPMVGVKHLLDVWISTTAHILETKSELEKDLWSSKSCYWSLSLSAQQHSYTYRQVGTSWVRLFCATADGQRQHKLCTFTTLWKVNSFITWWKKSTHSPSYEKVNTLTIQWAHWEIK